MTDKLSRLARSRGGEIAVRDERVELTWSEIDDILNRTTNALRALDLQPDQRISVLAENSVETLVIHLGTLLAGVSSVPVNFHLTADEVAYILVDSGTSVLFVGPETAAVGVEAARIAGVNVIGWRLEGYASTNDWATWLAEASNAEPPTDHRPVPNLLYTSGTTGRPKGTELPPTMFAGGATVAEHLTNLEANPFALFGTHLVVGPMYHTGPLSGFRALAVGVPVVILGRFDPERTLAAIERYRIESSVMVPTHFVRLLQLPPEVRARYDVSSLRLVPHTGTPRARLSVKRAMIEWFGPVLIDAYGATEVGTTCQITSEEWLAHPGSVGRAVPPFTALVVDEDGEEVPAGVEGRLHFIDATGRGVVYHGHPEKSAAAHLRPGVFTLGEIGYVDVDGFVYITDRFSDLVLSGGVNIYPAEAEQVLLGHPDVEDVACIGVPHAVMGEELKALVVAAKPDHPPAAEELISFCYERLAHYKCPRTIEVVPTVGRTTMGKVNKRTLRAPYWGATA